MKHSPLWKATVAKLVKKFPVIYRTSKFIVVVTRSRHRYSSWASWIQFTVSLYCNAVTALIVSVSVIFKYLTFHHAVQILAHLIMTSCFYLCLLHVDIWACVLSLITASLSNEFKIMRNASSFTKFLLKEWLPWSEKPSLNEDEVNTQNFMKFKETDKTKEDYPYIFLHQVFSLPLPKTKWCHWYLWATYMWSHLIIATQQVPILGVRVITRNQHRIALTR
jgi:hypothetical protein